MAASALLLVSLGLIFISRLIIRYQYNKRLRGFSLPPGPKRMPVVGNLLDLDNARLLPLFDDWANKFGDLVYIEALGNSMVVISSAEMAFNLLDKRSAIYSNRPTSVMDDLMGWDWNLAMMTYGPRWRDTRRCFHQYFNQVATLKYRDAQTREVYSFLRRVSGATGQISRAELRHMLASIIADIVYGMPIKGMEDEYIQAAETATKISSDSKVPGAYWLDYAPILRFIPAWVPGAKARRLCARYYPIVRKARDQGFNFARSNENAKDSIALDLIAKLQKLQPGEVRYRERVSRDATGFAYVAAIDTTLSFLSFFFTAMAMHPEIQKKAQNELDEVVGSRRVPGFEDFDSLPYIAAVILECARWTPVTPLGVPHKLTKDDYYNQYFIPKDTVVWPNVQRMLHNPEDYPEPARFNPERFLRDGKLNPDVRDPTTLSFGFGRRICPGRYFAKDNAFIMIITVLHIFDIVPSIDEHGNKLDPTPVGGIVSYPKELSCALVFRSETARKLIGELV